MSRAISTSPHGAGVPLFGDLPVDIALTHVATRHYASGLVQSEYVVGAEHVTGRAPLAR